MTKHWFITGSSRGIGRSLVEAALAAGDTVVATARDPGSLAGIQGHGTLITLPLDVTDEAAVRTAVTAAVKAVGRLDVVVNNAGQGLVGAFEEMTEAQFAQQIAVNFTGVVNVTRAVLPLLREQRRGHLIQISSVGGRVGVPGLSGYQAAKFAMEGFSEVLFHELKPLGIAVTIVEPGGFRTDWASTAAAGTAAIPDYEAVRAWRAQIATRAGKEPGDPARAAQAILALAAMESPPLRVPFGSDAYKYLKLTYESGLADLERTKAMSLGTDFTDAEHVDLSKTFDRRES